MNQTTDCAQVRMCLGVYVLGAIDPTERAMVDAHLATCRDCRDELAGLAGIPALLSRITTDEVLQIGEESAGTVSGAVPADDLLGSVLDLAAARRRRRVLRSGLLAAAAAVVIAVGAFTGTHVLSSQTSPPSAASVDPHSWGGPLGSWETASGGNSSGEIGWVSYRPMGWGVQLDARVVGIPVGTTCQLYAVTRDGKHYLAGQWSTDRYENNVWYPASVGVSESDVTSFVVTTGGRTQPVVIPVH